MSEPITINEKLRAAQHTPSLHEDHEVIRALGGIVCNCSPETNGHIGGAIGPAGMCPDCGTEGPFYQQALQHYTVTHNGTNPHENDTITKRYRRFDWAKGFSDEPEDIQWLKEDFLERGTLNCLFSKPGVGKSLLSLEIAIDVVRAGGTVMYMDDENRGADVVDRARSFGCKPDELENLVLYSFQNLPPLDTELGGEHLDALAEENSPDLVILDTVSRMIKGGENDADTFIQLYRCSLTRLKKRGITILRLDHTGKDSARGQRGSSAKESDADCLWYLTRDGDDIFTLENQKSRAGHVPFGQLINLKRLYDPLRHVWDVHIDMPLSRFEGIMRQMDYMGISTSLGRPAVRKIFKDNGVVGVRNDQLSAAIIERRNRARRQCHVYGDSSQDSPGQRGQLVPEAGTGGNEGDVPF